MRNLKALVMVVFAICALGAVMASAAQAAKTNLTSTVGTSVILTGSNDEAVKQVFTVSTGQIICTTIATPETTVKVPTETVTIHPEYTGCTAFGLKAAVTTTGCNYIFKLTESATVEAKKLASLEIECEAGKTIKITATGTNCVVTVGAQKVPGDVIFTNAGTSPTEDLTLEAELKEIVYTETGTNCKTPGVTGKDSTYTGKATVKGFEDKEGKEGNQVGILID